ncbi:aromatic ring-hydroxylating dioxygenase subunit alpha [Sphingomonas sp. 28-63-12]|uniref:aromatic ring-hydroxylating oxygenase subunit alpha n=1 Tax=Sphingomonas sp. 28-63-12 TaxID=1970434 RepID=UPI0035A93EC4
MLHKGWYQIAFARDLSAGLNGAAIGTRPLALVRDGDRIRAFEAVCPHRGANLCRGGTLIGEAIRCPFHGLSIGLGSARAGLGVAEYPCLSIGGLVFVRAASGAAGDLPARLAALDATAFFVPGFELVIGAPAELVIENAFDGLHFRIVHAIGNQPDLRIVAAGGSFAVEGEFLLPPSPWQQGAAGQSHVAIPYRATAYSPTLVIAEMGGANPYMMITATVPAGPRQCVVRLSLVLPPGDNGAPPDAAACRYLLDGARRGLMEDKPIWEAMVDDPPFAPVAGDAGVTGFRAFCAGMR